MISRAGHLVQARAILETHGHVVALGQAHDFFQAFAVAAARNHDVLQRAPGGERFADGIGSGQSVHDERPEPLLDERGDGLGGDGFPAADGVHAFVCLGFEVDALRLDAQGAGKGHAHGRKVRAKLGLFGDDDGVNVSDAQAAFGDKLTHAAGGI